MTPAQVLRLLQQLGEMLGLGVELVRLARQVCPELRDEELPDAAAAIEDAREVAAERIERAGSK
jgi:hypothetical protein